MLGGDGIPGLDRDGVPMPGGDGVPRFDKERVEKPGSDGVPMLGNDGAMRVGVAAVGKGRSSKYRRS